MFFKGSRYAAVDTLEITDVKDRVVRYKHVRLIPEPPASMAHRVNQGERLDHIAERYFRDPERFWRICDANNTMNPADLIAEPGCTLRVSLPYPQQ